MATQYIHFTEEQKQTARQTDIAELLRRQGQTLKRSGSEYEWKDGSAKVTVRGNLWFHQYDHEGGDAIDFVRRFMGKSYPEAVEFLLSGCGGSLTLSPPIQRQPPKPFVLPWSCFVLAVYLDHKIDPEADPLGIGAAALILGDRQTERIQFHDYSGKVI